MMAILHTLVFILMTLHGINSFDAGWTNAFLRSKDSTHYSITECALLETAAEYLKEVYGIDSMQSIIDVSSEKCDFPIVNNLLEGALQGLRIDQSGLSAVVKTISDANRNRDFFEVDNPSTHFDNEMLDEGARLISERYETTLSKIREGDYEEARKNFGYLLHTVQDFYSHSNWIELGYREPNKGIGKYQILGRYASKEMRTCRDCADDSCSNNIDWSIIRNNILTSGYFIPYLNKFPHTAKKPLGKCSHGGIVDSTTATDARGNGINKDTLSSPHGHLHKQAASVAYNATRQILRELWTNAGTYSFGKFLSLATDLRNVSTSSLIIVMDTTGSMGPYINMAKQTSIEIVNSYQILENKPYNYILSPFNDPTWGPLTISSTAEHFTNEINKLFADGGGDEPELYYHGIIEALKVCEVGSSMFVFTDAPAKDAYLKSQTIKLAKEKHVSITLFYARRSRIHQSGSISSRIDDVIEDISVSNGNDLTSITGGAILGVDTQSLSVVQNYIMNSLDTKQQETILLIKGVQLNTIFYVDSSMKSLRIEVKSSSVLPMIGIRLIRPSGSVLIPALLSQTQFVHIYTMRLEEGDSGQWTLESSINVIHEIHLSTKSDVSCTSTLQEKLPMSSSDMNFVSLTSKPLIGKKDLYVLTLCENLPSNITVGDAHLIDVNNGDSNAQKLTTIQISPHGFLSVMTVPSGDFRVGSTVHLNDGSIIQRQERITLSPTSISLTIDDQPYRTLLHESITMNYTIYNYGSHQARINLHVSDSLGLLPTSSLLKTYDILGAQNISDSLTLDTAKLENVESNSSIMMDSVIFSISALAFEYQEAVSVYIKEKDIPMKNQSEYQQPPRNPEPPKSAAIRLSLLLIQFIPLFLVLLYKQE